MPETITTDNKTLVRELYAAMTEHDVAPLLNIMSPDVRWTEPTGWVAEGTFNGPADVARVMENVLAAIGNLGVHVDDLVGDGDRVFALGRYTGRAGGTDVNVRFAHAWTFRDGRVTDFENVAVTAPVARIFS